jgi:UDP-N-acetylglucosamine 2-epimerase
MAKLKVITILGTRPEIIRLAATIARLDKHVDHKIVHTGQNYDYELSEIFFKELDVRKPDYFLNVNTSSLGQVYGNILIAIEPILKQEKPDAVLILGDTNSSIAGIIAKRLKIPIYHMEAGNRCFDLNVPEEVNRKIIDHISDFNLCYTEHARRNLIAEGLPARRIYVTGSPMKEVLYMHLEKIRTSGALRELGLEKRKYFLVSAHREENVDNKENLLKILTSLERIHQEFNLPVIVSTHPRTRKRLETLGKTDIQGLIRFLKPFGFIDYNWLQLNACCVISDSGTICEESAILDFPAITIRNAIERPEALDAGTIVMTGFEPEIVVSAIKMQISDDNKKMPRRIPPDYEIENTSYRVVKLIMGTTKLSHIWNNIKFNDLI